MAETVTVAFSFTSTITMAALGSGLEVRYLPIRYGARVGRSKIRPVVHGFSISLQVLRMARWALAARARRS